MEKTWITDHFALQELYASGYAERYHIDNTPSQAIRKRLENLVKNVLEPARQFYGKPIHITSGYRCPAVNRLAKGKDNSQHLRGEAADFVVNSEKDLQMVFNFIEKNLPYDQLLFERNNSESKSHWIHVSCKLDLSENRKQVFHDYLKFK